MVRMLPNILKNLLSKPATVHHPFVPRQPYPEHRGRISFDMEKCDQCQDCERVCPPACIKVDVKAKTITYNPFKCIYCHVCVENCMPGAIRAESAYQPAAYQKEIAIYDKKQIS